MKLCECGCGEPAPIAKTTDRRVGHVRGQPVRFVRGHWGRGKERSEATRLKIGATQHGKVVTPEARRNISLGRGGTGEPGEDAIHRMLAARYPKTGICEECGEEKPTEYAFQKHPAPYTTDRADYRELCRSCHMRFDEPLVGRTAAMREARW